MKRDFEIYTDGACIGNGQIKNVGGWGFVCVRKGQLFHELIGTEKDTTNNRQELSALVNALTFLQERNIEDCIIWCDSQYVVNGFNTWMYNWQKKNWMKGYPPEPVKNDDLWKELFDLSKCVVGVTLKWVRGHNGNKWNEYIDEKINAKVLDIIHGRVSS